MPPSKSRKQSTFANELWIEVDPRCLYALCLDTKTVAVRVVIVKAPLCHFAIHGQAALEHDPHRANGGSNSVVQGTPIQFKFAVLKSRPLTAIPLYTQRVSRILLHAYATDNRAYSSLRAAVATYTTKPQGLVPCAANTTF